MLFESLTRRYSTDSNTVAVLLVLVVLAVLALVGLWLGQLEAPAERQVGSDDDDLGGDRAEGVGGGTDGR